MEIKQCVTINGSLKKLKKKLNKYLKTNKNENMIIQNLWETVKVVLKGKFLAIQAQLMKKEKPEIT